MFEREIMVSSLKSNSVTLAKLVEELEANQRYDVYDMRYCQETLKRIETSLRKIRKMNEETVQAPQTYGMALKF